MSNLMLENSGARGDCLYSVPALNVLRRMFDNIYQCGQSYGVDALGETGLIDKFIVKPKEFRSWDEDFARQWLTYQARDLTIDKFVDLHRLIAGRLMFHKHDPKYKMAGVWKRAINRKRNYFDEVTKRIQKTLQIDLSEAIGKRPITKHTHKERSWLRDFRYAHNIPRDAFLLGWQFAGSSRVKWYPYFQQVIQENIMRKYSEVYVVGTGDLKGEMEWAETGHHGRYVNLTDTITFRQAYILTSIFDLLVSPETGVYVGAQAYPKLPKILLATHTDGTHITCGDESVILAADCECAPCYNIVHTCDLDEKLNAPLCIASIKPERVIKAITNVIERKRRMDALQLKPLVHIHEIREAMRA